MAWSVSLIMLGADTGYWITCSSLSRATEFRADAFHGHISSLSDFQFSTDRDDGRDGH